MPFGDRCQLLHTHDGKVGLRIGGNFFGHRTVPDARTLSDGMETATSVIVACGARSPEKSIAGSSDGSRLVATVPSLR